jgi:hypothetical protein
VQLEGGTAAEHVMDLRGITLGADDITQKLNRKDEGCTIM